MTFWDRLLAWTRRLPLHLRRGRLGERAARRHLRKVGLKFLTANYRSPRGEIDLIFRDHDCLVFVEVKTRSSEEWTRPAAAVDADKRRRLSQAALDYLGLLRHPQVKIRFDIVEVLLEGDRVGEVRHLPHTFSLTAPYRYGFTLVELLVVVAIIGLLAALLLPSLGRSKATGQSAVCKSNLRQLGIGLQTFVSDYHYYPENRFQTKPLSPAHSDQFWCARLAREGLGVPRLSTNFLQEEVWRCPAARWSESLLQGAAVSGAVIACYGYNDDKLTGDPRDSTHKFGLQGHYVPGADSSYPWADLASASFTPIAESEVIAPSDMMAIGDCFEGNALLRRDSIDFFQGCGNILTRHRGKANVVFCDGHVESPRLQFLFEDTSNAALARWNRDHQPHRGR